MSENKDLIINTGREGFEEPIERSDLEIPRVRLLQGLSNEVTSAGSALRAGMIINSVTKEVLPEIFVPIFYYKTWMRFNVRDVKDPDYDPSYAPGQFMWSSNDPNDERVVKDSQWRGQGIPPLATKFLNFFVFFPDHGPGACPLIVSFSKTSYGAGKRLLSLAQLMNVNNKPAPMFAGQYKLTAKQEISASGGYYVYIVETAGPAPDEALRYGQKLWQQFRQSDLNIAPEE